MATRHVTKRDGRLEGEPDVEPDAGAPERRAKEEQRDLTSLSGTGNPPPAKRRADEPPAHGTQ
jgi:hypothetical protein